LALLVEMPAVISCSKIDAFVIRNYSIKIEKERRLFLPHCKILQYRLKIGI